MKIHLIKSPEVAKELFTEVVKLLQAVPGAFSFSANDEFLIDFNQDELEKHIFQDEKDFSLKAHQLFNKREFVSESRVFPYHTKTVSWKTLFEKCEMFRAKNKISNNECIFLLTNIPNENNWFSTLDFKNPINGFIHTADWDYYLDCNPAFPIAYEVIALILHKYSFANVEELEKMVHQKPVGCISDMCMQKNEIILKMRTADVCPKCMAKIQERLPIPFIIHSLALLESLRVKMLYAQNFKQFMPLSKLLITNNFNIILPDFHNIEINLRPLEKTLYFLFLHYPEGILMSHLTNHREMLYKIYEGISNSGDIHEMKVRINQMCNILDNSASEKISGIKREFKSKVGETIAKNYIIEGANGNYKKIALDRTMVEFEKNPFN
jgi:hypothetical protein